MEKDPLPPGVHHHPRPASSEPTWRKSKKYATVTVAMAIPAVTAIMRTTFRIWPMLSRQEGASRHKRLILWLFPRDVADAQALVCDSRRDEQQVGKPVQVD